MAASIKRLSAVLLAAALLTFSSACSGSKDHSSSPASQSPAEPSAESSAESSASSGEEISVSDSSAKSPLMPEKWGKAAKYCTEQDSYVDVPVRILSVRRGDGVKDEVRRLADQSLYAVYSEPKDSEEYAIADYELSLDGFPVGKGGTLIDVYAVILGTDGDMLKLSDGSYFSATAMCLNGDDNYRYEGIVKGKLAYKIPKGCTDYLLVLGEVNETQAFVQGV